jgi:hypothetical protein
MTKKIICGYQKKYFATLNGIFCPKLAENMSAYLKENKVFRINSVIQITFGITGKAKLRITIFMLNSVI